MSDPGAAWLRYQIQAGETAPVMRQSGATWRQVADALHLGTKDDAMRAVALHLSSRLTHGEGAGDARAGAGTRGRPAA